MIHRPCQFKDPMPAYAGRLLNDVYGPGTYGTGRSVLIPRSFLLARLSRLLWSTAIKLKLPSLVIPNRLQGEGASNWENQ